MPLFFLFLILPLLELMVFGMVSEHIGLWTTLGLCLLTALIGSALVRMQGVATLFSMRRSMDQGQMPLNEIFDGFCLVAAGALLITPGFVTDTVGFLLLTPSFRNFLRRQILAHTNWAAEMYTNESAVRRRPLDPDAIEGEFERIDEDDSRP